LSQLAEEVVEELKRQWPDRQVKCNITPGLAAYGDKHLLKLVFDNCWAMPLNLRGNALLAKLSSGSPWLMDSRRIL